MIDPDLCSSHDGSQWLHSQKRFEKKKIPALNVEWGLAGCIGDSGFVELEAGRTSEIGAILVPTLVVGDPVKVTDSHSRDTWLSNTEHSRHTEESYRGRKG